MLSQTGLEARGSTHIKLKVAIVFGFRIPTILHLFQVLYHPGVTPHMQLQRTIFVLGNHRQLNNLLNIIITPPTSILINYIRQSTLHIILDNILTY